MAPSLKKILLLFILIQFIQFLCTYVDKYTYLLLYSITLLCPFCAFFGKTMDRLLPYTIHSIYFLFVYVPFSPLFSSCCVYIYIMLCLFCVNVRNKRKKIMMGKKERKKIAYIGVRRSIDVRERKERKSFKI